jgi:hypothetical protein
LENLVQKKFLTVVETLGETANIIYTHVINATANDLETDAIRLSADNTYTDFGGLLRSGKDNVLTKIKSKINRNIIGFCCNVHKCAKVAFDSMPVDVKILVTKIFG